MQDDIKKDIKKSVNKTTDAIKKSVNKTADALDDLKNKTQTAIGTKKGDDEEDKPTTRYLLDLGLVRILPPLPQNQGDDPCDGAPSDLSFPSSS